MSSAIIYSQCVKLKTELESTSNQLINQTIKYEPKIKSVIENFSAKISQLDQIAKQEINNEKRSQLLLKVDKLRQDHVQIYQIVEKCRMEQFHKEQELQRIALLGQQQLKNRSTGSETQTVLDIEMMEARTINESKGHIQNYISMGNSALQELIEQRYLITITKSL